MICKVIAGDNVYLNTHCPIVRELAVLKLRRLLNDLGFNPVAIGTQYIIEELKYFFEHNIGELNSLKDAYSISANIHSTNIKNIQWDIESAIFVMNKYAPKKLLEDIFYWFDSQYKITPRYFFNTIIVYLDNNCNKYKKN